MTHSRRMTSILAALAAAFALNAYAAQGGDAARPTDPTANRPSDTGAQSTNPSGAVTGAGQPQVPGAQGPSADAPKKAKGKHAKKRTAKKRAAATLKQREAQGGETPRPSDPATATK